ncbi:MAG: hypothetical protein ABFD60_00530 [Bryobacteraceae bacterium]
MRNAGPILVIALVALLAVTLFLLWGPMTEKPGMRNVSPNATESAPEPLDSKGNVARREDSRGKRSTRAEDQSVEAALAAAAAIPPSTPAPATTRQGRRFPTAADIPAGTERYKLETTFGKPNMRMVSVEQGKLLETLVYLQSGPDTATFVLLRNGKVVSANTTIY